MLVLVVLGVLGLGLQIPNCHFPAKLSQNNEQQSAFLVQLLNKSCLQLGSRVVETVEVEAEAAFPFKKIFHNILLIH